MPFVTISRDTLFRHGLPSDTPFESDWTPKEQIQTILGPLGGYLGYMFERELLPPISLHRANLSGLDLSEKDLSYGIFMHCDLSGADLSGSQCRAGVFQFCNLTGAKGYGTDFTDADFDGSTLHCVRMQGAKFALATFGTAGLFSANFKNANFREADLRAADVDCACFDYADMTGASLPADFMQWIEGTRTTIRGIR